MRYSPQGDSTTLTLVSAPPTPATLRKHTCDVNCSHLPHPVISTDPVLVISTDHVLVISTDPVLVISTDPVLVISTGAEKSRH